MRRLVLLCALVSGLAYSMERLAKFSVVQFFQKLLWKSGIEAKAALKEDEKEASGAGPLTKEESAPQLPVVEPAAVTEPVALNSENQTPEQIAQLKAVELAQCKADTLARLQADGFIGQDAAPKKAKKHRKRRS